MISMKNIEKKSNIFSPRFVSMEMAAIFDFRALTKVHIWAIPHWRAYIAKKLILFQQDTNVSTYVQHM